MNSPASHGQMAGSALAVMPEVARMQSDDCEAQVIAHVLADTSGSAWALAQSCGVKPEAFSKRENQTVWRVIGELRARGELAIDAVVLATELQVRALIDEVGGYDHLNSISINPSIGSVRGFAEQLVLMWQLRYTLKLADGVREAALTYESREKFIEDLGRIGSRLIRLGRREATVTLVEQYSSVEEEARARAEGKVDQSRWVSSGNAKFDHVCKKFGSAREDHFIGVAGGSGMGKSVVLRQFAAGALDAGQRVLSYSRETSIAGFIEMLVSAKTGIDLNKLERMPRDMMERFYVECARQKEAWADKLLFCVQNEPATPLVTVEDIVDHARAFVHLHGCPELILVDYLQLFSSRKRLTGSSREAEVAHVSHTLQALQRELGCVMCVAAQVNEKGLDEMRTLKRDENGKVIHRLPKPGDLRESQAFYHDVDRMIFLYKPPVDNCDRDQSSAATIRPEVWWFQEKRRRGGVSIVRNWFEKAYVRFVPHNEEDQRTADRVQMEATKVVPPKRMMSKSEFQQ